MSRRNRDPMIMADPRILIREEIKQSEHVEMHECEEIIDDIICQVSSINSGQDNIGSESSNENNVKCVSDSDVPLKKIRVSTGSWHTCTLCIYQK